MGNLYMEASQINYRGGEKKMSVEEALKNTSGEAAAIAQLQQDVIDLNDVKANKITIAPAFSAEASYDPGDLVYYNGLTYRCVNAHEGEWDADDFAATTIANELSSLMSGLTNATKDVTSDFTLAVSTLEDVFFTVEDDPVSRVITIHITGNSSVGFPNGGITITAPSKYRHNIPNGVVLGAGGVARSSDDTYAFVIAVTSSDGVGLAVNYSQSITAANLSFTCSYRYVTN